MIYSILFGLVQGVRGGDYGSRLRIYFLRKMGCKIGQNSYIGPNVTIVNPSTLIIGNNVSIHQGCYIDAKGQINIGDDVSIAHQCSIISFNHVYRCSGESEQSNPRPIKSLGIITGMIIIESDVWMGCKCVILPGTHLKRRTVVAAMSLCNKDYSGHELIGGIPAKHIQDI